MNIKCDGPLQALVQVDGWDARISLLYGSQSVCIHNPEGRLVLYASVMGGIHDGDEPFIQASYSDFEAPLGRFDTESIVRLVAFATRGAPAELRALLGVQP